MVYNLLIINYMGGGNVNASLSTVYPILPYRTIMFGAAFSFPPSRGQGDVIPSLRAC